MCKQIGRPPAGLEAMHAVAAKIERLNAPSSVTVEPVLISAAGITKALAKTGFFSHILGLDDLLA
ncbi:MAG: hypothetical protein JXR37_27820 [Kiritimatiellae bacterium]|nr:hypothetical protein [Kiritimatiellia bacterium]